MTLGKSFAWLLFLAVVAIAGSLGHHQEPASPHPQSAPALQLAATQPSTVALDTTHVLKTRATSTAVK